MSDKKNKVEEITKEEAFEMIELLTEDLSVLARAFETISAVCEFEGEGIDSDSMSEEPQVYVH